MGIHTVTVVWDTFEKAARVAARVRGVPGLSLAVIPHRAGGATEQDQMDKADAALPDIVRRLLGNEPESE
ncbi:MAG TPA: hypothetical protein VLJ86_25720 [Ramlibacter sp.]|nr:hypothetical protein [Ramlibacter sp.]